MSQNSPGLKRKIINDPRLQYGVTGFFVGLGALNLLFDGGILLLQHIAGPSFAFKRFLKDIIDGKKPRYPMKLRKYDFFSEQADLLNSVYEKYEIKKNVE